MDTSLKETLIGWAEEYNDPRYFQEDPIIFPTQFARKYEVMSSAITHIVWIMAILYARI